MGPCVISVWTHPDVGIGTFFVLVYPRKGGTIPKDLNIQIGVQPVTGRLPEKLYSGQVAQTRDPLQYNYEIPFDAQEMWRVHIVVDGAKSRGETTATVEVTPTGFGRWDLLLYAAPFLAVGFLVVRGLLRKRRPEKSEPVGAG